MADSTAPTPGAPDVDLGDLEGRPRAHALAEGKLGLAGVLFCIVTAAAPIAAMLFNVPIAVLGGGYAAPAAFIVATVVLTIFAVGYIEMARRVTAAGGFYSFVTHGFGPIAGMGTAVLIALCYVVFSAAVAGITGYFASTTLEELAGITVPGWLIVFVLIAINSIFGWFRIEFTAKVLGVFLVAETVGLLLFVVGIAVQGGDSGIGLAPLNPANLIGNEAAIATFGAAATGVALFGAFWSWVGFEMAPNYAEESRDPRKLAAWAMYGSVVGLGVLYTLVSWMFVAGWGEGAVAGAVNAFYEGEVASPFYPLTDRYFGGAMTVLFQILIVTGSFACQLAFYNTAARYFYAMGRERLIPERLGHTHPRHRSPHIASMAVSAIIAVYALGFVLYDPSTEAMLVKLGTWSPLLGVLGILGIQSLVSFAIIRYFLTEARDGFHPWKTLVAPLIGGVSQIVACYLLITNRELLAAAEGVPFIVALPWVVLTIFVLGVLLSLYYRARDPSRYRAIGRFVHEDAVAAEPAEGR